MIEAFWHVLLFQKDWIHSGLFSVDRTINFEADVAKAGRPRTVGHPWTVNGGTI
jgi:hypothetical protein